MSSFQQSAKINQLSLDIDDLISKATQHHQAGRLDQAEGLYQKVLQIYPSHGDCLHLLGLISAHKGRFSKAIEFINKAIRQNPDFPAYYFNRGMLHHRLSHFEMAVNDFKRGISLAPDNNRAYCYVGSILCDMDRVEESIQYLHKATQNNPDMADAHFKLGIALTKLERLTDAASHYEKVIMIQPDNADAYLNLGVVLVTMGHYEDAISYYEKAIQLKPNFAEAICDLGVALAKLNRLEDASDYYRKAILLKPQYADAHYNLARALYKQGDFNQAIIHYQKAIQINPDYAKAYCNIGVVFDDQNKIDMAIDCYSQALRIEPDYQKAEFNLAMCLLKSGDYDKGWQKYESRLKIKQFQPNGWPFSKPRWQGEAIKEGKLFVCSEYGHGDTIHFIRYLPIVKEKANHVIFECQKELYSLLKENTLVDHILYQGMPRPSFDLYIPIMSLPFIFKTNLMTIPNSKTYIKPLEHHRLNDLLKKESTGLSIGIVWAGSKWHKKDKLRSISLEKWIPLFHSSPNHFYSLQYGSSSKEIKENSLMDKLTDLSSYIIDFSDTAALINQLDLIITVDTAIAHLAGAMGKPTWILLPYAPDFRWLLDRDHSPWYSSVRLFRQLEPGDWESVFESVTYELKSF